MKYNLLNVMAFILIINYVGVMSAYADSNSNTNSNTNSTSNLSPAVRAFVEKNAHPLTPAQAMCTVVINKSPAWAHYDVNVSLRNFLTQKLILTFHLPGQTATTPSLNLASAKFNCSQYSIVQFFATFSPPIWGQEKNHIYPSRVIWNITDQVQALKPGQSEVQVEVNFPNDFIDVPSLINFNLIH